jgi:hypothetical protein
MKKASFLFLCLLLSAAGWGQQEKSAQSADEHHSGVTQRGDEGMGFSHAKTTHHFRLFKDGGAIEVTSNDPADAESRDMIRMHLAHIAKMFTTGNFQVPMFIHDTDPPGAKVMAELREQIQYQFIEIHGGGKVQISSRNPQAVEAIHSFLRFQITDHRTGDSVEIGDDAHKE